MPTKKLTPAQRLKVIRPYVAFNYDLRKPLGNSAKRKIKRYYDEFRYLSQRPTVQIYRGRKQSNLLRVQRYAQHEKGFEEFKVAFVPVGTEKAKIKFDRRGDVIVENASGVKRKHVHMDGKKLVKWINDEEDIDESEDDEESTRRSGHGVEVKGAREYIRARIDFDAPKALRFTISTGSNELPISYTRKGIAEGIIRYLMEYRDRVQRFNGVFALYGPNQSSVKEYIHAKNKARKDRARKRLFNEARKRAISKK